MSRENLQPAAWFGSARAGRQAARTHRLADVSIPVAAALLGVLGGVIAGSGDAKVVTVVVGAFIGVVLLFNPRASLWLVIFGTLIFAGLAQLYVPQIQFIRWPIAFLSAALGMLAAMQYWFSRSRTTRLPSVFWWGAGLFSVVLISSLMNHRDSEIAAFGLKGYFQVFGLFIAMVMYAWPSRVIERIPAVIVGIAFLQLPFVLHQYFVLVPSRASFGAGLIPEDVVAGTMGASVIGGGANAVLSILLLTAVAILTALFKKGELTAFRFATGVLILICPILLNANKVAILYLVILYLLLFSTELFRRPGRFIMSAVLCVAAVMAIAWSYTSFLSTSERSSTWQDLVRTTIENNTKGEHGGYGLNRSTVVGYWYEEHERANPGTAILGHGPGASRERAEAPPSGGTLAERAYPGVGIGITTISAVLWEIGVVGLLIVVLFMLALWRAAGRLARLHRDNARRSSVFLAFQAAIVIFALSFFHKNSFVFYLQYQALLMLIAGYIGYWEARSMQRSGSQAHGTALGPAHESAA